MCGEWPHYVWTIWRERNSRCFEDHEKTHDELKNVFVKTLFNWVGMFNVSLFSTLPQFVDFCSSLHL